MGRSRFVAVAAIAFLAVVAGACGEGQKVGSEKLLEFEEQQNGGRLGERTPEPVEKTAKPLTVDQPTPRPTPKPTPKGTPSYFDVTLVPDSPYYKPGNRNIIRVGVTLRGTNKDNTAERAKGRSFTAKNGAFHSGLLKPGQSWTWTFNSPGAYEIIDEGLNFATGILEVIQ